MNPGDLQKTRAAIHGCLLFAALVIVNVCLPALPWPWYLVLPLLVYAAITLIVKPLRQSAPRLSVGCLGGLPLLGTTALSLTTASVLIGFQAIMQPDVTELAAKLPIDWIGNVLLAGVCFSVVNAVLEEVIFRGILWEVIGQEWNQATALVITSALFGIAHLHGYPPGPLGAILAGLYGIMLGGLRWWSGGLGLAVICHVVADATIFGILVIE